MQEQSSGEQWVNASSTQAKPEIRSGEWRFVTVDDAARWLSNRAHNRRIRQNDVSFLARQMREGLWRKNPQPLLFEEKTGRLLDGQHRLSAMIEANIPMWFRCELAEEGVFPVLDTGRGRNGADILSLLDTEGVGNYSAQAAALRMLVAWEKNRNPFIGYTGGSGRLSNLELTEGKLRYPNLLQNVQRGAQLQHAGIPGGAGTWGAILTKFELLDVELCEDFYEGVLTGAGLAQNSPILVLRNRLRLSRSKRYAFPRVELVTLVIRAWNTFVRGRDASIIRGRVTRSGGVKRTLDETFPEILTPRREPSEAA